MNSYGLVFGGEKTSHDSGNDITYKVVTGNNYSQVVIEGDEYILPKEAMQSEKVYDFVDKLPIEMLDEIKRSENVFIQFPNLRHGDMVVCKNSVRNDDLHTIKGTAKEIANYLQGLSACRMYAKGGYISGELANGGGVEDESQLRLLTPMPPTKLGKTGIDSLTEIVGKDELREAMSGALYAGKGRIVATDAHILVVLENQNYPKSLDGTIKSLWNKVPQERLVGIPYPNWEAVVPNQQLFQTKELSIDDALAYAYGGFLEGKKIIKEKDFDKYEKRIFKYILRLNIGNIEVGVDSLMLTRILRVLRANDVRKIVLHITGKQKAIKITTDKKHYGLIMPVIIADKVEDNEENIYVSQQIFYPISDKDFRAMSKKYGEYLTEFSKMVVGLGGNQIPTEYEYLAILRPISEAYPKENLIRIEEGGYNRYGKAVYSKPLSIREIEHFGFFPATEIKMIGTKIYYYQDFVAEIKTDIKTIYLSKDIGGGEIEMELMSPTKFLEKIKSGEYRPLNEMAEGGEITMNVPLLLRVLELAKEDVKEDKELHFIAERLQSLSKKGTLTMEDYDYISGLESNDKIQKMIAENDSKDSDLRFEQGGGVEDEINPEQIRAEIEALEEILEVLEGEDRQSIQEEIEILKLALGELEHTKLLAPNGKPSNLTPEQWHLVRTPQFKAWFGDWENSPNTASKVVDENGEPLVVFREIEATEKNYFNTEVPNFAKSVRWQTNLDRILRRKLPSETKVGDEVIGFNKRGVVTEINNGLFKIKYEDGSVFSGNAFGLTFYGEKKPKKVLSAFLNIRILGDYEKLFVHSFGVQKDSGILSISPDYKTYFTFRSNQVKLADGSNTTFDANNPDIRYEQGGGIKKKSELLAPNGKPSNLTPEQWHLVRTPEFKAWFGDWEALENAKLRDKGMDEVTLKNLASNVSKVVDENGEPMVVWHFAKRLQYELDKFYTFNVDKQLGSHFGTLNQAQNLKYLISGGDGVVKPTKDITDFRYYQVFLNIKNPIRLKDVGIFEEESILEEIEKTIRPIKEYELEYFNNRDRKETRLNKIKDWLLKNFQIGGVVYLNRYETNAPMSLINSLDDASDESFKSKIKDAEDSWIAFYPNQIKLADGSNTTFDSNNPDIRFEKGGGFSYL